MRLDDATREGQSQAGAASLESSLAGGVFIQLAALVELAEDDFLEIGVHAPAAVADDNFDARLAQDGFIRRVCEAQVNLVYDCI
jgi:hypothetical protein